MTSYGELRYSYTSLKSLLSLALKMTRQLSSYTIGGNNITGLKMP